MSYVIAAKRPLTELIPHMNYEFLGGGTTRLLKSTLTIQSLKPPHSSLLALKEESSSPFTDNGPFGC